MCSLRYGNLWRHVTRQLGQKNARQKQRSLVKSWLVLVRRRAKYVDNLTSPLITATHNTVFRQRNADNGERYVQPGVADAEVLSFQAAA